MTYKVHNLLELDVPSRFGSRTNFTQIYPRVITSKWIKNNHLEADELTVTIGWKEGGLDPRLIKNARGAFWIWDSARTDFDRAKHLKFTGIAKKITRKIEENGWVVEITFHDYTTLFINNKPLKTDGLPYYTDTLQKIWERICDNTGWQDPANGKILSNVSALRDSLVFAREDIRTRTLGEMTNKRFLKIARPSPKHGASSWDVWQWVIGSLGLISYIDKDQCVITDTTEHYAKANAARAIYGENIHTLEESVDTDITSKGILLKSLDPLTGRILEAFYPPPGDERIKTKRSAVSKKSEEGAIITANEVSGQYEEYNRWDVTDQKALDNCAQQAYEERSRQEIEGSFKTAEMTLFTNDGDQVEILDLRAGEALAIATDPGLRDTLRGLVGGEEEQIRYLVEHCDYDEDVALLIARNLDVDELNSPIFHIKSIELDHGPDNYEVEVKFHNLIVTDV